MGCFLPSSFPSGFGLGAGRCGRGVCPSSVACPCCFSRSCPSGFRPWLRCSVYGLCGVFVSVPYSAAGRARSSSRLSLAVSVSFPFSFIIKAWIHAIRKKSFVFLLVCFFFCSQIDKFFCQHFSNYFLPIFIFL